MKGNKIAVLFVCLGNICRSPTAQAVFSKKVAELGLEQQVLIDSAGTSAYHLASPPDPRAIESATVKGYQLAHFRAKQVSFEDLSTFDFIIAMDYQILATLEAMQPKSSKAVIRLLSLSGPDNIPIEIPDPFYGPATGFEQVVSLLETSIESLLIEIAEKLS